MGERYVLLGSLCQDAEEKQEVEVLAIEIFQYAQVIYTTMKSESRMKSS